LKRKNGWIGAVLALCAAASIAVHAETLPGLFESDAMNDSYDIRVHLPSSYDSEPERSYQLVVILDANYWFDETSSLSNGFQVSPRGLVEVTDALVAAEVIPEVILVGVGYPGELQRGRDFHGSPQLFFSFLRSELLPAVEQQYRVDEARGNVLFGHSSGGFFAAFAFLHSRYYGYDCFQHVLAISGDYSRNDGVLELKEELLARRVNAGLSKVEGALYFAYGEREENRFQVPAKELSHQIQAREYPDLRLQIT